MYVARLASLYDVSYNLFCSRALQIPLTDRDALSLTDPSDEVLERLSTGVGVPVEDLRALRPGAIWCRLMAEINALVETEEGRKAFEAWFVRAT
ncbi:MAG: hypothetical protein F4051_02020 [Boseongicola sp. SB0670_bin_30]|nr:hypothetical protein [Boseongicola sp. SB0670_bin_30]